MEAMGGERMLGEGEDMTDVLRHLEVAESTWNRWRNQHGGMNTAVGEADQGAPG